MYIKCILFKENVIIDQSRKNMIELLEVINDMIAERNILYIVIIEETVH